MTRRLTLFALIALNVQLLAAPSYAGIGHMDMDPGATRGSGSGGGSLAEEDIQAIAVFVTELGKLLDEDGKKIADKLGGRGPSDGAN